MQSKSDKLTGSRLEYLEQKLSKRFSASMLDVLVNEEATVTICPPPDKDTLSDINEYVKLKRGW